MRNFILLACATVILLALFFSQRVFAYPELIRHGYVNCMNCHASPTGGGALTDYGRTFSGEGLSTWSRKGEESLFHGLVPREKIPEWLMIGGDVRAVQLHMETETVREGRFVWMQADVEAAAKVGSFTFDVSVGRFQRGRLDDPKLKSRRYFAMYNYSDEMMIRVGRFMPAYGLNLPDHVISTRQGLGFDQGLESHNLEASYIGETWNVVLTAIKGPVDSPESSQETALAGQVSYAFWDTYKVGASVWNGSTDARSRTMAGFHGQLGFTESFYLLTETDLQWSKDSNTSATATGLFNYQRLGYEIHRGVHLLGVFDLSHRNLDVASTLIESYGTGIQLFPRPHFEILATWTKQRARSRGTAFDDYAYLMLHYYL